jgi:hypothetical protein
VRNSAVAGFMALSVCAAAFGTSLGIQIIGLPPAPHADRVAADAAAWLLRYRVTEASLRLGDRRASSVCLHTWFPNAHGQPTRGVMLMLEDGTRVAADGSVWSWSPSGTKPWHHLSDLLELAGCPTSIGNPLATAAANGTVGLVPTFTLARPALALQLPVQHLRKGKERIKRFTLYVSASSYRPIGVALFGPLRGASQVRLVRATRSLLARFRSTNPRIPGTKSPPQRPRGSP